jgi:hypothetical protein
MIFIFSEEGLEDSYNDYRKKFIVKLEKGMCSFLWVDPGRKKHISSFILTARLSGVIANGEG